MAASREIPTVVARATQQGARNDQEDRATSWITIAKPPLTSVEQFKAVQAATPGEPDGLQARYVAAGDGEMRIVAVWESKAHADRFFAETLGPALARALGPEPLGKPEVIGLEVASEYVREGR